MKKIFDRPRASRGSPPGPSFLLPALGHFRWMLRKHLESNMTPEVFVPSMSPSSCPAKVRKRKPTPHQSTFPTAANGADHHPVAPTKYSGSLISVCPLATVHLKTQQDQTKVSVGNVICGPMVPDLVTWDMGSLGITKTVLTLEAKMEEQVKANCGEVGWAVGRDPIPILSPSYLRRAK